MENSSCSGTCLAAAGYACIAGSTSATGMACAAGQYSLGGTSECTICPSGRYGAVSAMESSSCSGTCLAAAGYVCIAGSTSATGTVCAVGQYSLGGTNSCTPCSAGQYGSTTGLNDASCSGLCDAGRYGSAAGLTVSSCTAVCSAGFFCPAGSTNGTANICPMGQYSTGGAASCTACAAGRYGNTTGLTSSSCSGACEAGRYG
jgi:hypothetical protein